MTGLRLSKDELLTWVPNKGYSVADITMRGMCELFALRGILEASAAELACERATPEQLEAAGGDTASAEVSLQHYAAACPWMTPAGIDIYRARNQMVAANQRRQSRVPWMPETWVPLHEARAALAGKDYASAEHLLRRTLFLHRWLLTFVGQSHTRSPLVSLLCHFHLGQVYEATGKRGQAADEYREFLSPFEGSASPLPQIPEARAALKRLSTP